LDRGDLIIPRIRIIQPTSQIEDSVVGEFHNNVTGHCSDVINVVILRIRKGRVYWDPSATVSDDPLCASDDGLSPRGTIENPFDEGQGCLACRMAQWIDSQKPPCALVYNYLCVDPETLEPFVLSLKSTSAKTAKRLNYLVRQRGFRNAYQLHLVECKGEKGRWFEARVSDAGPVKTTARFVALARQLADAEITTDTEGNGNAESRDTPF